MRHRVRFQAPVVAADYRARLVASAAISLFGAETGSFVFGNRVLEKKSWKHRNLLRFWNCAEHFIHFSIQFAKGKSDYCHNRFIFSAQITVTGGHAQFHTRAWGISQSRHRISFTISPCVNQGYVVASVNKIL